MTSAELPATPNDESESSHGIDQSSEPASDPPRDEKSPAGEEER